MNRKKLVLLLGLVMFAVSAFAASKPVRQAQGRPNIIFILADDQGWNGLSVRMNPDDPGSGSTYYRTPRLAKLAKEGMRFSNAYSPGATCSPTRHSIQYSRTPVSLKQFSAAATAERRDEDSLANCLKNVNSDYSCAHFGKWHMGPGPDALGYDVNDGSNSNGTGNSSDPKDPKLIFALTKKATDFMEKQVKADKPFFLQISHYADHLKYQALQETTKEYETTHKDKATKYQKSPLWAAMNENMDTGIGMVLDKIDELGIRDNTYVIYTADNGFEQKGDSNKPVDQRGFGKAFPIRSHKYTMSEGGIRVPFIVRGPGIPANSYSSTQVVGYDIFPTVLDIAGGLDKLPEIAEGGSLLPLLKSGGTAPVKRKNTFFIFRYSKTKLPAEIVILEGQYKLLKEIGSGNMHLWDLKADIGESKNLASEKPELVKTMYGKLTAYLKQHDWDESKALSLTPAAKAKKTGEKKPSKKKKE